MKNAKKWKNTKIFIDEDFCPSWMKIFLKNDGISQAVFQRSKRLGRKGNIAYLNY